MYNAINSAVPAIVAVCFLVYVLFDCLTLIVRAAGSVQKLNAAGAAFEKIMVTFKRTAMFMYPPILGIAILANDTRTLFTAILCSFIAGCLMVFVCAWGRSYLLTYCEEVIAAFAAGAGAFKALFIGFTCFRSATRKAEHPKHLYFAFLNAVKDNKRLFVTAAWVILVYSSSIFIVNALALRFSDSAVILLQTLGLINGLGTLLLAFVVDPIIARYLDKAYKLDELILNVFAAQGFVYGFAAPLFFMGLFWVLFG
jgi:hypothetical protein